VHIERRTPGSVSGIRKFAPVLLARVGCPLSELLTAGPEAFRLAHETVPKRLGSGFSASVGKSSGHPKGLKVGTETQRFRSFSQGVPIRFVGNGLRILGRLPECATRIPTQRLLISWISVGLSMLR
jgi:hypothetical protein